jgi:hypothetical protein
VHGSNVRNLFISTSKNALSFLLLLMSSLQQNWIKGQNRFSLEGRRGWRRVGEGRGKGGEMAQTMYAHMNN